MMLSYMRRPSQPLQPRIEMVTKGAIIAEIKNHILLDFDGVCRAEWYDIADEPVDEYNHGRLRAFPVTLGGDNWVMLLDPDVIAAVHRWTEREDTKVYWFSANGYLTYEVIAPAAGLPVLGWAPHASEKPGQGGYPGSGRTSRFWWKAQSVTEFVAATEDTGERILWIDDHISTDLNHHMRNVGRDRLSFLIPESRLGLMPDDIARVESWLNGSEPFRYRAGEARRRREGLAYDLGHLHAAVSQVEKLIAVAYDETTWQAAYDAAQEVQEWASNLEHDTLYAKKVGRGEF